MLSWMDMRLTYNNDHSIWTDPTSEFLHIEFGWSFFCKLHRHIFNSEEYEPTLVTIELRWMMIHRLSQRIRMLLGQHLLFGSTNIYVCMCIYIYIHTLDKYWLTAANIELGWAATYIYQYQILTIFGLP